jgi:hypothetical protein
MRGKLSAEHRYCHLERSALIVSARFLAYMEALKAVFEQVFRTPLEPLAIQ